MKHIALSLLGIYLLTGCGSGTSDTVSNDDNGNSNNSQIDMKLNRTYTVYPGDKVEKTSAESNITISHINGHEESTIKLISGSAILIRK